MKALRIVVAVVMIASVFTLSSCGGLMDFIAALLGGSNALSITERVEEFFDTLNTDPDYRGETELADHFYGLASTKDQLASDIVAENSPLRYANAQFSITRVSVAENVATYTFENTWFATGTIALTMELEDPDAESENYLIKTLTVTLDADGEDPFTLRLRVPE